MYRAIEANGEDVRLKLLDKRRQQSRQSFVKAA